MLFKMAVSAGRDLVEAIWPLMSLCDHFVNVAGADPGLVWGDMFARRSQRTQTQDATPYHSAATNPLRIPL